MTAFELLSSVRAGLDRIERQAREALDGANDWWSENEILRALLEAHGTYAGPDARHIAAWSPSRVLALVGVLRQLVDGYEGLIETHEPIDGDDEFTHCCECSDPEGTWNLRPWPCLNYSAAITGLELLASLDLTGDGQ